jgi:hypothetical protein
MRLCVRRAGLSFIAPAPKQVHSFSCINKSRALFGVVMKSNRRHPLHTGDALPRDQLRRSPSGVCRSASGLSRAPSRWLVPTFLKPKHLWPHLLTYPTVCNEERMRQDFQQLIRITCCDLLRVIFLNRGGSRDRLAAQIGACLRVAAIS